MFINTRGDVRNRVLIGFTAITRESRQKTYTIVHSHGIIIGIIHKRQFTTSLGIHAQVKQHIGIYND